MGICPSCGNHYPESFDTCPVDGTRLDAGVSEDPLIGALLMGTYRVEAMLASGGMGRVYRTVNERIGRPFAVKVLSISRSIDTGAVERFFREARAAASLRHPGVVEVVDCALTPEGMPFMVMELLAGRDLRDVLESKGKLDVDRTVEITLQVASALHVAHQKGIVHRDIKPGNLFVEDLPSGGERVKILDFGIARLVGQERLTNQSLVMGTPEYSSPEQARDTGDVDQRSDIYSLGATVFHFLCGRPPFIADTPVSTLVQHLTDPPPRLRDIRSDVPTELEELVLRMLAKDPEQRPQTARDVTRELSDARGSASTDQPSREPKSRSRVPRLVDEVRVITVVVVDIEASSAVDVEEQVSRTSEAYDAFAEEVTRQGGEVERLYGNRAVGVFGLTLSFGDEALRAVRAAFETRRRVDAHARVRIALGTGRALVKGGSVSTAPAAGPAGRLLRQVELGVIASDSATYSKIRGVFGGRALLRGADDDRAYELSENRDQTGLRSTGKGLWPDLTTVGRDDEMEQLWHALMTTVRDQCSSLVCISGEPGIGKSRVKTDFAHRVDSMADQTVYYLEGAGQPMAEEQPYSALSDLLRRWASLGLNCTLLGANARLNRLIEEHELDANLTVHEPVLASIVCAQGDQSSSWSSTADPPEVRRRCIAEAFVALVQALSAKQPVVFCLEDAHLVDQASLDVIRLLLDSDEELSLMIVLVGRTEVAKKLGDLGELVDSSMMLSLGPLSRSETRSLLLDLLRFEPPRRLQDVVWKRSLGVPLFIEEIFHALRERGDLSRNADSTGWSLREDADLSLMPATVQGVLQARLDTLQPDLKQLVRKASVLGTTFWDRGLAALGASNWAPLLSELAGRGIVVPVDVSIIEGCREYEFRSAMLRDVAYGMIPSRDRAALHSKAADWIAAHGAPPRILAHHLELSRRLAEAADAYVRAGELARSSCANEEALALYRKAFERAAEAQAVYAPHANGATSELELSETVFDTGNVVDDEGNERTQLRALLGRVLVLARLGRTDDALETLEHVDQLAIHVGDRSIIARAAVRRGALVRMRDPKAAVAILEGALKEARAAGDRQSTCEALLHLAQAKAFSGGLDEGAAVAAEAVSSAREVGLPSLLLQALIVFGTIATIRESHWHGLPPFQEALTIARETRNLELEADILQRCGFLRSELGDFDGAESDLRSALRRCDRSGNQKTRAFTLHNLGWVLWKLDKRAAARQAEVEALEVSRQIGMSQLEQESALYLAIFDIGEGDLEEGLERAREVIDEAKVAGHPEQEIHGRLAAASSLLLLESVDEAVEMSVHAVEALAAMGGSQQFEVELHLVAAACLEAGSRTDEARAMRQTAQETLSRRLAPIDDEAARERLLNSIGVGLPPDIMDGLARSIDNRQ